MNTTTTTAYISGGSSSAIDLNRKITVAAGKCKEHSHGLKVATFTIDSLKRRLSNHEQRDKAGAEWARDQHGKNGSYYLSGSVLNRHRLADCADVMHLMTFDFDAGETLDSFTAKMREHGLGGAVYTTYSNGATSTEIALSTFAPLSRAELTPAIVAQDLIEAKGYVADLFADATLSDPEPRAIDPMLPEIMAPVTTVILRHKPIQKFRATLILEQPFVLMHPGFMEADEAEQQAYMTWIDPPSKKRAEQGKDKRTPIHKDDPRITGVWTEWREHQQAQQMLWVRYLLAVADKLGATMDGSCIDVARLFFSPACPPALYEHARAEWVDGSYLDLATIDVSSEEAFNAFRAKHISAKKAKVKRSSSAAPRVKSADAEVNAFMEAAEEIMSAEEARRVEAARVLGGLKTANLGEFIAKYGKTFQVADYVQAKNLIRCEASSGTGWTVKCPSNGTTHDAKPEYQGTVGSLGCFVRNPCDHTEGNTFVLHCTHDTCRSIDRAQHLDKLLEQAGVKDAVELEEWISLGEGEVFAVGDYESEPELTEEEQAARAAAAADHRANGTGRFAFGDNFGKQDHTDFGADARSEEERLRGREKAAADAAEEEDEDEDDDEASAAPAPDVAVDKHGTPIANMIFPDLASGLKAMNEHHAIVQVGNAIKVMCPLAPGETLPAFLSRDGFLGKYEGTYYMKRGTKKKPPTRAELAPVWLGWCGRTQHEGLYFSPNNAEPRPHHFNLWPGFHTKKGDETPTDWVLLRYLLREVVCKGNKYHFDYFQTWIAHMFQHPERKTELAVLLRGKKGTGKSKVAQILRDTLGAALSVEISDGEQLLGKFNKHRSNKVLIVADEAIWGGDRKALGKLKNMVTSPKEMMEPKGLDATEVDSYCNIMFTSNEGCAVPAEGEDERRFFVLDVSDRHMQDIAFFACLDAEMEAGGFAAFVRDMKAFVPPFRKGFNVLRKPPVTSGLIKQRVHMRTVGNHFAEWVVAEEGTVSWCDASGSAKCFDLSKPKKDNEIRLAWTDWASAFDYYVREVYRGKAPHPNAVADELEKASADLHGVVCDQKAGKDGRRRPSVGSGAGGSPTRCITWSDVWRVVADDYTRRQTAPEDQADVGGGSADAPVGVAMDRAAETFRLLGVTVGGNVTVENGIVIRPRASALPKLKGGRKIDVDEARGRRFALIARDIAAAYEGDGAEDAVV